MQEQLERKAKQELLDIGDREWDANDYDEFNNIKENSNEVFNKQAQESQNYLQTYFLSKSLKRNQQKKEKSSKTNKGISLDDGNIFEQRKFNDKQIEKKYNGLNIEKKDKIYKVICKNSSQLLSSQSKNASIIQSNVDINKQTYAEQIKQTKLKNKEEALQKVNQISSTSFNFKVLSINAMQNEYIPYQKHLTWIYNKDKNLQNNNLSKQQSMQIQSNNYEQMELQQIAQQSKSQIIFKNMCYQNNPQLFYLMKSAKEREIDLQSQAKGKLSQIQWNLPNNSSQLLSEIINKTIQKQQSKKFQISNLQKTIEEITDNENNFEMQLQRKSSRKSKSLLEGDLQKIRFVQTKNQKKQINQKLSKSISRINQQSTIMQNDQLQQDLKRESSPYIEQVLNKINIETTKKIQKLEQYQSFSSFMNQKFSNQLNNISQNEQDIYSQTPSHTNLFKQRYSLNLQNNKSQINFNQYKSQKETNLDKENSNKIISQILANKLIIKDDIANPNTKGTQTLLNNISFPQQSQETDRLQNCSQLQQNEKLPLSKITDPIKSISVTNLNLLQNLTDRSIGQNKFPDFPIKKRQFSLIIPSSSQNQTSNKSITPIQQKSRRSSPVSSQDFPKIEQNNQDQKDFIQSKKNSKFLINDQQEIFGKDQEKEQIEKNNNILYKNYKIPSALYKSQKLISKQISQNVSCEMKQNEKQQSEKQQLQNNILMQNIKNTQNPIENLKQFKSIVESTLNKKQNQSNSQKSSYIQQNIYTTFARQKSLNKFIYSK